MQSFDYEPRVSGWKLDKATGELEINSAKLSLGALPSDPQLITVTAGEWAEYELPSNAMEHYAFIGDELVKIPFEYRDSAELSTGDNSFDRDGSDVRTTLTYERLETGEEVAARQQKAKVVGSRLTIKDGLFTIYRDGVPVIRIGDLSKAEPAQPFVLVDDQVLMNQALIEEASIAKMRPAREWSVMMTLSNGKYVASGIGLGVFSDSQLLVSADKFAIKEPSEFDRTMAKGADALLELLADKISETELGKDLASEINKFPDLVRETIRKELRPGGLLYRSR